MRDALGGDESLAGPWGADAGSWGQKAGSASRPLEADTGPGPDAPRGGRKQISGELTSVWGPGVLVSWGTGISFGSKAGERRAAP